MSRLFNPENTLQIHLMRTALAEGGVKFCLDFVVPRRYRLAFLESENKHLSRLECCIDGIRSESDLSHDLMRDVVWDREKPSCTFVVRQQDELKFTKYFERKGCDTNDFDYMAVAIEMRTPGS